MKKGKAPKDGLRFTSILERSDNRIWGCHFRVPDRIAKQLITGKSRRVLCSLNGSAERQCGILHRGPGIFLITVNKKLQETFGLEYGMKVRVTLRKDKTEYGLPLPEELRELLRQDTEGNALFHALTRGKQRTLLYIIGSVKSPEKRLARAITIVNHLKANGGKINYKRLYPSLKAPLR